MVTVGGPPEFRSITSFSDPEESMIAVTQPPPLHLNPASIVNPRRAAMALFGRSRELTVVAPWTWQSRERFPPDVGPVGGGSAGRSGGRDGEGGVGGGRG